MFLLANLIDAIAQVLNIVLYLYMWVIIIRALLTWVNPDPYNQIVRFLYQITEPVLYPVRKKLSFVGGGLDLSPVVVILAIFLVQKFFIRTMIDVALKLRMGG